MKMQNENENENGNANAFLDDEQNFKDVPQADYDGQSSQTTRFNGNTDTVQSLSSYNPS